MRLRFRLRFRFVFELVVDVVWIHLHGGLSLVGWAGFVHGCKDGGGRQTCSVLLLSFLLLLSLLFSFAVLLLLLLCLLFLQQAAEGRGKAVDHRLEVCEESSAFRSAGQRARQPGAGEPAQKT